MILGYRDLKSPSKNCTTWFMIFVTDEPDEEWGIVDVVDRIVVLPLVWFWESSGYWWVTTQ